MNKPFEVEGPLWGRPRWLNKALRVFLKILVPIPIFLTLTYLVLLGIPAISWLASVATFVLFWYFSGNVSEYLRTVVRFRVEKGIVVYSLPFQSVDFSFETTEIASLNERVEWGFTVGYTIAFVNGYEILIDSRVLTHTRPLHSFLSSRIVPDYSSISGRWQADAHARFNRRYQIARSISWGLILGGIIPLIQFQIEFPSLVGSVVGCVILLYLENQSSNQVTWYRLENETLQYLRYGTGKWAAEINIPEIRSIRHLRKRYRNTGGEFTFNITLQDQPDLIFDEEYLPSCRLLYQELLRLTLPNRTGSLARPLDTSKLPTVCQSELDHDEQVFWAGKPDREKLISSSMGHWYRGGTLLLLGSVFQGFFLLIFDPFLLIGLIPIGYGISYCRLAQTYCTRHKNHFYLITDRRVLIWGNPYVRIKMSRKEFESFLSIELTEINFIVLDPANNAIVTCGVWIPSMWKQRFEPQGLLYPTNHVLAVDALEYVLQQATREISELEDNRVP